ncbi:unnamed protein product [Cuscuta epithymum]|uniref:DUF4378 domain-containing protein n=1 Tax=Cuscuta epithymum TaxID=186058 RepID=A0AAV0CCC0_9ASTE|nr:unnamed protein product [Cuscuta epithymum]
MEVEKRTLKGGFLHLFDWNLKSRKKLFSSKAEVHGNSKQRKEYINEDNSEFQKVNDYRNGIDVKQNYDSHSNSSVSGDEVYGQRPPGVVARLMGLDSLPTSQVSEFYQAPPPPYCQSYRDSHYTRATNDLKKEHQIVVYEDIRNKLDGLSKNPVEMRLKKLQNLPIERFQTETLPPKSAKTISVTRHRMLSPIKSHGFIPPKNAEYIIEASSRIIQQSPRLITNNMMQQGGTSSVPLRIRDLREKMNATQKKKIGEASQSVRYHHSYKHMKRQPAESFLDVSHSKGRDKSVSLAVQAKTNIQKREGSIPGSNNNTNDVTLKEHNEGKYGSRKRSNGEKSVEKRKASKPSNVLRQNNQKQNGSSNKDEESPKPSVSFPRERKSSSSTESSRPLKTVKKVVLNNRNSSGSGRSIVSDMLKEPSSSRSKTCSRKKIPGNDDILSNGTLSNNVLKSNDEKSVKCNVTIEGCTEWDRVEKRNGSDVISFTFTSPIKKTLPDSTPFARNTENKILSLVSESRDIQSLQKSSIAWPLGMNIMGGDALGILLDEKPKELTFKVSSGQDSASSDDIPNITSAEHFKSKFCPSEEKTEVQCDFVSAPLVALQPKTDKFQQSEDIEDDLNRSYIGHEREFNSQYLSPASTLESSVSGDSYSMSDNNESFDVDGTNNRFAGSHRVRDRNSSITLTTEDDAELIDSASSLSIANRNRESTIAFMCADMKGSTYWELEYIRRIIRNADLTRNDKSFSTETHNFISANLFDQLELHKNGSNKSLEDSKHMRKVLFDCVVERLEAKNEESVSGSFQKWERWNMLVERKEWLSEELYREVSCLTEMEELMVDEVVEKDMSTRNGKWIEFGSEELELGIEFETAILTSLVEELVFDISCCHGGGIL